MRRIVVDNLNRGGLVAEKEESVSDNQNEKPLLGTGFNDTFEEFKPVQLDHRFEDRNKIGEWLKTSSSKPYLWVDEPEGPIDGGLGEVRFNEKSIQNAEVTLARLGKHFELGKDMSTEDMSVFERAADRVYSYRGALSRLRDAFSFIFGKSVATSAYEKLTKEIKEKKELRESSEKVVGTLEKAFGSGVSFGDKTKKAWLNFFNNLSSEKAFKYLQTIDRVLLNPRDKKGEPQVEELPVLLLNDAKELQQAGKLTDEEYQTLQNTLNSLGEQFVPHWFNTQYRYEYLPKYFMSENERNQDDVLQRESKSRDKFDKFRESMHDEDVRKKAINEQIEFAKKHGFEKGKNFDISFGGGGTLPDVSIVRFYGIQCTKEGFQSILGLSQGDRRAIGTDVMHWQYKTTDQQNAAIMKLLRELEKLPNSDREKKFSNLYSEYGKDLQYDEKTKSELKKALLKFAADRESRINLQLQQILPKAK